MEFRLLCILLCSVLSVSSGTANSQDTVRFTGIIQDQVSGPVTSATVVLVSLDRALRTKTVANGSCAFDDVPIGVYEVEITAPGFAKQKFALNLQDNTIFAG